MCRFMLILQESPAQFGDLGPDEMQRIIERYSAWSQKLAQEGRLVDGIKLTEDGGKVLSVKNGRPRTVDGPYAEAKEVIGGIFVLEAEDYDEAAEIASSCPHVDYGTVAIREVDRLGQEA